MSRAQETFWLVAAMAPACGAGWWLRGWTIHEAVEASEARMWEKFLEVSKSRGLYRLEGQDRDAGHDEKLADHERRLEALEEAGDD